MRGRELAHCGLVCGLLSQEIWVQTSHLFVMAQILRICAVPALDSAHVDDDVDLMQVKLVFFKEKVRSRLCEADVDRFEC
jgi:hypothetical protein